MQETWIWSLGEEDPLGEEMATHSSVLAKKPTDRGAPRTTVHGVARSQTWLSDQTTTSEQGVSAQFSLLEDFWQMHAPCDPYLPGIFENAFILLLK